MRCLHFIILFQSCLFAVAQNRVFGNTEMVNFNKVDLSSVGNSEWSTAKTITHGIYANYGSAKFTNFGNSFFLSSVTGKWINGYVKHYATDGNKEHLYPVGSESSRHFLETKGETPGTSICVAWLPGLVKETEDFTKPFAGIHHTDQLDGLSKIFEIGQWDWITDYTAAEPYVLVSVKIPDGYGDNDPEICLAGWRDGKWHCVGDGSPVNGIIQSVIKDDYSALAIGKRLAIPRALPSYVERTDDISKITFGENDVENCFLQIYPNPARGQFLVVTYKLDYTGAAKIVLYDMVGKLILEHPVITSTGTDVQNIDISGLPSGFYTLQFCTQKNEPLTNQKKLIIQN